MPSPTATLEPTPAPLGSVVNIQLARITVLDVITVRACILAIFPEIGRLFYKPNPGSYLIDVGVLVKNNSKDVVQVKWGNVYVVEESGDAGFQIGEVLRA